MNNIWFVMVIGGLLTFGMRFSFIYLFGASTQWWGKKAQLL